MTDIRNTSGLKPVGHAILIRPYEVQEYTAGGIMLPNSVRVKDQIAEQKAVIIEIGRCAWRNEPEARAKVGDKVLFSKWAGYQAVGPADGDTYRIVNDADIFTIITAEEKIVQKGETE